MSRLSEFARPRYRLDNFFTDLNVVCDLESDPTPSSTRLLLQDYLYTAPLAEGSHSRVMSANPVKHTCLSTPLLGGMSAGQHTETDPLIPGTHKKPFYRARPLWLVPFAIATSLARGMTLAPRVEVYTQLSCNSVYGDQPTFTYLQNQTYIIPAYITLESLNVQRYPSSFSNIPMFELKTPNYAHSQNDEDTDGPMRIPSARCISDPAVQSATARLQTLMTTIMGVLSALTTGWWGQFSERYGRTRVLAISAFALFLVDLTFILVSIPSSPFSRYGHMFLLMAPVFEGLFGGYGALQSATSAYISDCTSPGSRAQIFSRFAGVTYFGIAIGPSIGGWLIRHPLLLGNGSVGHTGSGLSQTVIFVFLVAAVFSFLNFVLAAFILPESLSKGERQKAREEYAKDMSRLGERDTVSRDNGRSYGRTFQCLFGSLAVFLPVVTYDGKAMRRKTDWSLTILAVGLFGYYLSQGVYQLKYLYAEYTYGWGAEELSYYISFLGGVRVLFLLFMLPSIISVFKPETIKGGKSARTVSTLSQGLIVERVPPSMSPVVMPSNKAPKKGKKVARPHLARQISFDLSLAKISFFVDLMSNVLIALVPTPTYTVHAAGTVKTNKRSRRASGMLFIMASSLGCFGSGVVPATQSLVLCALQARNLGARDGMGSEGGAGSLFSAFAVLQAVGSTILGPILFGLVYSETVAKFPKAVFALAAAILFGGFVVIMFIRHRSGAPGGTMRDRVKKGRCRRYIDVERGRSRVSKDLRGGAIPNYMRV
ncbi:hypothetical protein AX15_004579 [Amanita polypyramis BW_CC]|nr:hypothetical protein AX15_004579 [Amanita polypyramis BW_CC]